MLKRIYPKILSLSYTLKKILSGLLLVALFGIPIPSDTQAVYYNRKISGDMPAFGDVIDKYRRKLDISPDGQYVVFMADREADEIYELYSVPMSGGEPLKLNTPLTIGRSIDFFLIAPNSQIVVYLAYQEYD
jgi:hypothetical protein